MPEEDRVSQLTQAEKAAKYDEMVKYLKAVGGHHIADWVDWGRKYKAIRKAINVLMKDVG